MTATYFNADQDCESFLSVFYWLTFTVLSPCHLAEAPIGCRPSPRPWLPSPPSDPSSPAQGRLRSHTDPGPSVDSRSPLVLGGSGPPSRCSCAQMTADCPGARSTVGRARRDQPLPDLVPLRLFGESLFPKVPSSVPQWVPHSQGSPGGGRTEAVPSVYTRLTLTDRRRSRGRRGWQWAPSAGSLPPPTDTNTTD